jgi:ketosteroid isomerase-like protein
MLKHISVGIVTGLLLTSCATVPEGPPPLDVVRAKFDAVNRRDLAAIVAAYAPDAHLMASDFCSPRDGRGSVERTYRALLAIEDLNVSVDEAIADGNRVLLRIRVRGAFRGQRFEMPIANYFEVRDGLIAYDLGVFNNGTRPCQQ